MGAAPLCPVRMSKWRRVERDHFPLEARKPLLAGQQFLHRALFEIAFFGEELLQGLDEGVCVAQRFGYGFLFGFGGRESNLEISQFCAVILGIPLRTETNSAYLEKRFPKVRPERSLRLCLWRASADTCPRYIAR